MSGSEDCIPDDFWALRNAIFSHPTRDDRYVRAVRQMKGWPLDIKQRPPVRVVMGYIRFLEDDNDRARRDFEESYQQAMSQGDWESACWACTRMALWHFYTDRDYEEGMRWIGRGRDLIVHDEVHSVVSHLGLMEGRLLHWMETDYRRAIDVLGDAASRFRRQGGVRREIWATWLRFEVLPEEKAEMASEILDDLDLEYWSKHYNPLELRENAVLQWAKCLAATGYVEKSAALVVDCWERRDDLQKSREEALFDVYLEAHWYGETRPGVFVKLMEGSEICREDLGLFMLARTKELLERGRLDECMEICEQFYEDSSIPLTLRFFFQANAASALLEQSDQKAAEERLPSMEEVDAMGTDELSWLVRMLKALIWVQRGAFRKALDLIEETKEFSSELLPSQREHRRLWEVELLTDLGESDKAWRVMREIEADFERLSPVNKVRFFLVAGYLFLYAEEFELARDYLNDGLSMAYNEGTEVFVPRFILNLEWAARELEDESLLEKCHAFFEENAARYPREYSRFQINYARDLTRMQRPEEAEAVLEKTLNVLFDTGQITVAADIYDDLSRLQEEETKARHYSRRAFDLLLALLTAIDDRNARLNLHARLRYVGARLATLQVDAGLKSEALDTVHEAKSGEFLYLLANSKGEGIEPDLKAALGTLASGGERLSSLDEQGASALGSSPMMTPSVSSAQRSIGFEELKSMHRNRPSLSVDAAAICEHLGPGEVAVEYFLPDHGDEQLAIFILDNEGVEIVRSGWSKESAEDAEELSELIRLGPSASPTEARRRQRRLMALLRDMYDALIAPVEPAVHGARRLLLAPGALLASIPYAALVSGEGEFLADRVDLGFLASTAQIPDLFGRVNQLHSGVLLRGVDDGDVHLERGDREIETIRGLLDEANVTVEDVERLWEADLIHYTGHAYFDEASAMDARLATAEGSLRAADFMNQAFQGSPLICLAGCETGRFDYMGDEIVGFLRSLFAAGASHVVASSWKADDEGTAWLIEEFYRQLLEYKISPGMALARASKAMRENGSYPQWRHPYYWANFRCWGAMG